MKKNDPDLESLKTFLKDKKNISEIESQTQEVKRRMALDELTRQKQKPEAAVSQFKAKLFARGFKLQQELHRKMFQPHNKHMMLITGFLLFSTYLCWKMEDKYYKMKQKVEKTKSYKQLQIEREQRYIDTMLKKDEFQAVKIDEELEPTIKYKFEEADDDDPEMDTKGELMDIMKEDYLKGKEIPEQYAAQFFRNNPDLRKSNI